MSLPTPAPGRLPTPGTRGITGRVLTTTTGQTITTGVTIETQIITGIPTIMIHIMLGEGTTIMGQAITIGIVILIVDHTRHSDHTHISYNKHTHLYI